MLGKKIGLQAKSTLVLTIVVLFATIVGGWLYYTATGAILRQNDRYHARRLASGLAAVAGPCMIQKDPEALQRLVADLVHNAGIHYACVLGNDGNIIAKDERVNPDAQKCRPTAQPPAMFYELRRGPDFLEIGQPVVVRDTEKRREIPAGAVRLVLDTRETAMILSGLRRDGAVIALVVVLCTVPLGLLLVRRVMLMPARKLAATMRQVAAGDFSVRAERPGSDQTGELASSFDSMVESLHASQERLRQAKAALERKLVERTGELEMTNNRLREEMAEKEDFLRAVSHDLGAPLRNIAGMAAMIGMKWREQLPEEVLARLQRIQANVEVQTGLIGELLELSRIRTRPETRELVDLGELMEDIRGTFEHELKAKDIEMRIHPPMPKLYVERKRMRQVFQNLVDNAIKYMGAKPHGKIDVGYGETPDMHVFHVADNGPGIAPEEQQTIFHIFRRAPAAATANVPGKGIGLALVKSVVSNYDGRVWVEPRPTGGSVFYVALGTRCTEGPAEGLPDDAADSKAECVAVGDHPAGG